MSNCTDSAGRISLDCGIAYSRIEHWLDVELALPRVSVSSENPTAWRYAADGGTCHIEASPSEESQMGPIRLERTLLEACGDEASLTSFQRRFTLRFMSAGG